jgi:hypothetical protein
VALFDQGGPDAGTPVGFPRLLVDHTNGREQGTRLDGPGTLGPCAPRVKACRRHGQGPAHQPDRIATVLCLDRAVSHGESLAKHAAARVKKSRAFRSVSFSRLSRVSSSGSTRTT